MNINEIPYLKVRALALKHQEELGPIDQLPPDTPDDLGIAFTWADTPEGYEFWHAIDDEDYEYAKELQPELFEEDLP